VFKAKDRANRDNFFPCKAYYSQGPFNQAHGAAIDCNAKLKRVATKCTNSRWVA
jgi:hypothetical protein